MAFIVTRAILVALTGATLNISASRGDIALYSGWAQAILNGAAPYTAVPIEYPPGVLPFVIAADLLAAGIHYRTAFTALMLLVDVAGLIGLLRIARKHSSGTGPWIWVVAIFLLGPIAYLRLDLIPAVATIWAIERAAHASAAGSGALWAFGAAAKLYPALLMPAALWHARGRKRFLLGAGIVALVAVLPFIGSLRDLWDGVIGYHGDRGIQIESSWGAALMIALRRGYDAALEVSFGAIHFRSAISPTLEAAATFLSIATVILGSWFIARRVPRGDTAHLAVGLYGMLAVVMFAGTVLSTQFILWLIALAAAALSFKVPQARTTLLLIVPIAALTQFVFPFTFNALKDGELGPLLVLIARNLLILGSGVTALLTLRASPEQDQHAYET